MELVEIREIIGGEVRPKIPPKGAGLYHFSNTQHPIGFLGHPGMWLTENEDFGDLVSDIDTNLTTYRHRCSVLLPQQFGDRGYYNMLEELASVPEELFEREKRMCIESYRKMPKWFTVMKEGAIELVENRVYVLL